MTWCRHREATERRPELTPEVRTSPACPRLLRAPWPCLSAGCIEGDRGTDERLERARVDLLPLMDVDGAPCLPLEARVEELGWVLQRSTFGERELHDGLVRLACADDSVVRPCGSPRVRRLHPLHLLDDVRVCLLDELAHPAQGLAAPVPELGDPLVNPLRCRLALVGIRLLHVLLPRLPVSVPQSASTPFAWIGSSGERELEPDPAGRIGDEVAGAGDADELTAAPPAPRGPLGCRGAVPIGTQVLDDQGPGSSGDGSVDALESDEGGRPVLGVPHQPLGDRITVDLARVRLRHARTRQLGGIVAFVEWLLVPTGHLKGRRDLGRHGRDPRISVEAHNVEPAESFWTRGCVPEPGRELGT